MNIRKIVAAAFLVLCTFLECGSAPIQANDNSKARYIITYKDVTHRNKAIKNRSDKPRYSFKIIPGFAADLSESDVKQLKKDPNVISVDVDAIRHTYAVTLKNTLDPYNLQSTLSASSSASNSTQVVPYGIDLVNARGAWPVTKGSGVIIADLDTGIDLNHPDIPTIAGSTTFTNATIQDTIAHGTHTAGTMAAPDNSIGVVGVAPEASLLIEQVFDTSGNAYDSSLISAIDWAVENGAKVINMSLGGTDYDASLETACNNAVTNGVVVVAAAGNDGSSTPSYPAAYSSVISVAAVDENKQRASFSNYGSSICVCAPGVDVLSTVPFYAAINGEEIDSAVVSGSANGSVTGTVVNCGYGGSASDFPTSVKGNIAHIRRGTYTFAAKVSNAVAAGAAGVIISNNTPDASYGSFTLGDTTSSVVVLAVPEEYGDYLAINNGVSATIAKSDYASFSGTSMAAPHVSGVAALIIAARHGDITPAEVKSALKSTAEDLGITGRDDYYGYGLVNAKAAVASVVPVMSLVTSSPNIVAGGDSVSVSATLSTSTGVSSVTANGTSLTENGNIWSGSITADNTVGNHVINVVVKDKWGNTATDSSASYNTEQVLGANAKSLNDSITTSVLNKYLFAVWGVASNVTSGSFVLNDGSGYPVTIEAAGHSVKAGNFVRARGILTKTSGEMILESTADKVMVVK